MGLFAPLSTASSMLDAGMFEEGANATGSEPIDITCCACHAVIMRGFEPVHPLSRHAVQPLPDIATMLAVVSAPVSSVRAKATQTK